MRRMWEARTWSLMVAGLAARRDSVNGRMHRLPCAESTVANGHSSNALDERVTVSQVPATLERLAPTTDPFETMPQALADAKLTLSTEFLRGTRIGTSEGVVESLEGAFDRSFTELLAERFSGLFCRGGDSFHRHGHGGQGARHTGVVRQGFRRWRGTGGQGGWRRRQRRGGMRDGPSWLLRPCTNTCCALRASLLANGLGERR